MVIGFDLDGTLVDSLDLSAQWLTKACAETLGKPVSEALVRSHFGKPEPELLRGILDIELAEVAFRHYQEFLREGCGRIPVYPNVMETLSSLRSEKIPLALISSRGSWGTAEILARHGLREFFEIVLTGDQVKKVKPAPEGILRVCAQLKVSPASFVYIGDSHDDVRAAERAGARGFHALWGATVPAFGENHLRSIGDVRALLAS